MFAPRANLYDTRMDIRIYDERHRNGVAALWREAFPNDAPWHDPDVAMAAKIRFQLELFPVAVDSETVIGTAMAG